MSRFTLASLILVASMAASGQNNQAPLPQPLQHLDLVVGSHGAVVRTYDTQPTPFAEVIGGFPGGYVTEVKNVGAKTVVLLEGGRLVVAENHNAMFYDVPPADFIVNVGPGQVSLKPRSRSAVKQVYLYPDGNVYINNLWSEKVFNNNCNQVFVAGQVTYCVDKGTSTIWKASPVGFTPADFSNPEQLFHQDGLVYAKPYKDGFLALIMAQYKCPETAPAPPNAVFCIVSGDCKEIKKSELVFIDRNGNSKVVTQGLGIHYASTLSVVGDVAYVVESSYTDLDGWHGDFVSKVDILTGKRSVYFSLKQVQDLLGEDPASIWID